MRVVFVAPFGLRRKTTVWARTLPLARVLARRGRQPTILIPPWDSPEDADTSLCDEGVELVNVAIDGGLPAITVRLLRELEARAPQIIHIIKPRAHAGIVQWLLWQQRRLHPPRRIVLDIDDWEQAWADVNHYPPTTARFMAWQEEWGIRHADALTAASRWLCAKAHDYAPQTPQLYLPNGVDLPDAPPIWREPPAGAPPTVLYFTRYVEVPPDWLADFAAALLAIRPQARLIVAGLPLQPDGDLPFRRAMTTRISGEAERIIWLGGVLPQSLPALRAASTVALFPALPVPLQLAKCSVRLATTLLDGLPVVASAVGEQAHYGAEGAAELLPPDAGPVEFARAAVALMDDAGRRREMVERAHLHLARHYRWDDLGGQLETFYQSLFAK